MLYISSKNKEGHLGGPMKHSFLPLATVLAAAISANAVTISPQTPDLLDGCYQISNAAQLYGFAAIVNGTDGFTKNKTACGKLTRDIVVNNDVRENVWDNPSGFAPWNPLDTFAGTFDGNGHTISGLYGDVSEDMDAKDIGFIRVLVANPDNPTTIKNLGIVDSWFFAYRYNRGPRVGIFAVDVIDSDDDRVSYAKISNCFNQSHAYFTDDDYHSFYSYLVRYIYRNVVLTILRGGFPRIEG